MMRSLVLALSVLLLAACGQRAPAPETLRVAVAANFLPTLKVLAQAYSLKNPKQPIKIQTMVGSTGLLYAQIEVGAPFDLFFSADVERPAQLVKAGKAFGSTSIYALGRLALWAPRPNFKAPLKRLREDEFKHLAIANPELAPYGKATRQVLTRLGLWQAVQAKLIRGGNVAQVYQYLDSGRADLGFVALSQVKHAMADMQEEAMWVVPAKMHAPLQQAVVVLPGENQALAEAFLIFCLSKEGRSIIKSAGYDLPDLY